MPAATASRRSAYSWSVMCGGADLDGPLPTLSLKGEGACSGLGGPLPSPLPEGEGACGFLVGGKFSYCLCDLFWVGHEEVFLRGVERHRRDVWGSDPHH